MLQPLSTDLRLARLPGPTRTFAIFVQFIYFAAHGVVFPGTMAGCVAPFPRNAGAAAERFGFVPMTSVALTAGRIGTSHDGTVAAHDIDHPTFRIMAVGVTGLWLRRLSRAVVAKS